MYTAGTISGTKGSNKITGKSTQWLSNLYNILEGQVIVIYTSTSSNAYSIKSIKSNTEIELSKPLYDAFTNATYEIFTTIDNTTSDAAVKIAQSINRNNEFMTAMSQWTTGTGTVTVNWGGEQVKLTTVDQMNKNIDAKFDKKGGEITGSATAIGTLTAVGIMQARDKENLTYIQVDTGGPDVYPRLNVKVQGKGLTNHELPDKSGKFMQIGDFGWGGSGDSVSVGESDLVSNMKKGMPTQVTRNDTQDSGTHFMYSAIAHFRAFGTYTSLAASQKGAGVKIIGGDATSLHVYNLLTDKNTKKDSNGNIKGASPVVEIYADHITVNEESEGVELKKLHTGIYQLKGTLGMNSDPSWGGIHGGIVVPNDINGLQLVYADYDVLAVGQPHPFNGEVVPLEENGDIVVYTTYRKHSDLPQNIQRARLKTYPEFIKEVDGEIVELSAGEPVDIPNGHWLDVRVQMPSNSVYNIRQAEQEELARIAAEKAEQEEIERLEREAIEEAERIEREEIERLEREEADRVAEEAERESYESNDGDQEL